MIHVFDPVVRTAFGEKAKRRLIASLCGIKFESDRLPSMFVDLPDGGAAKATCPACKEAAERFEKRPCPSGHTPPPQPITSDLRSEGVVVEAKRPQQARRPRVTNAELLKRIEELEAKIAHLSGGR